jgi:RNA polymerase sigma-70 factor (ECF subfamily)
MKMTRPQSQDISRRAPGGSPQRVPLTGLDSAVSRGDKEANPSKLSDPSTWVEQHGDYLFRYSLMRVRNRELAENLVQETFLAALIGRDSFCGSSSEKTWMTGILKHKIIDQFRKSFREKSISELQTDEEQSIDQFYDAVGQPKQYPKSWMPDPQALLHSKEFWKVFRSCLDRLPERTASAFIMRELDDRSTEEICSELEITPTNLWVMLYRARLELRGLLEKYWFERGVEG